MNKIKKKKLARCKHRAFSYKILSVFKYGIHTFVRDFLNPVTFLLKIVYIMPDSCS